jgi:nitrile hydratase
MVEFNAKKVAEVHQHLHSHLPSDSALRVKALETLLVEKG